MDPLTRPRQDFKPTTDDNILDYTAGLIDTDGTINTNHDSTCDSISLTVSVTQAIAGWPALELLWNTFGGCIAKHANGTEKTQASYTWNLTRTENIARFLGLIEKRLTIKQREAAVALQFPCGNLKVIPIKATKKIGDIKESFVFKTVKEAASRTSITNLKIPKDQKVYNHGDWSFEMVLTPQDVIDMKAKRVYVRNELKRYHHTAHDPIDDKFFPSTAYLAGLLDGEASFDASGKSCQEIEVAQKHKPLLEMLWRCYGGSLAYAKSRDNWVWSIRKCDNADKILESVYPYLQGKKKQAELLINMKPGTGLLVHATLRELKGKYTAPTPKIDKMTEESSNQIGGKIKELPRGVFKHLDVYQASIGVNKTTYSLGCFKTVEEAKEKYDKYKALAQREKRSGEKLVDWDKEFKREFKVNNVRLPELEDHKEKCIYATASRTYQVRIRKKSHGTFESLSEAITVRDREMALINQQEEEDWQNLLRNPTKNIYLRESKGRGLVHDVKIGGRSYGAYTILDEAIAKRNEILEMQRVQNHDD